MCDERFDTKDRCFKTRTRPKLVPRLFFLDLGGGRVMSCNPDGSDLKTIVTEARKLPDGVVVDVDTGHIYWTNMGSVGGNDGSIFRADLDGRNLTTIVPEGHTHTPKQLQLDKKNGKLYWSDREGMRVMRANLDGSNIETLIETGHGDRGPARRQKLVRGNCAGCGDAAMSIGPKRVLTMPAKGGFSAPAWTSPRAKLHQPAKTLNFFTMVFPSRSISISI